MVGLVEAMVSDIATKPVPVAAGTRVALRPVAQTDSELLFGWSNDLHRFNLLHRLASTVEKDEFDVDFARFLKQSTTVISVDRESSAPIGLACAFEHQPVHGWCSVLVFMHEGGRGQALGRDTAFLFWDFIFSRLGVRKINMEVSDFNRGWLESAPAVEAGLLVEEGVFKNHTIFRGERCNVQRLALFRDKWMTVRGFFLGLAGLECRGSLEQKSEGPPEQFSEASWRDPEARLLREFITFPSTDRPNKLLGKLAKNVSFFCPATGTVVGKERVLKLMTDQRAAQQRIGEAVTTEGGFVRWGLPEKHGGVVRARGQLNGDSIEVKIRISSSGSVEEYSFNGPLGPTLAYYFGRAEFA